MPRWTLPYYIVIEVSQQDWSRLGTPGAAGMAPEIDAANKRVKIAESGLHFN